MNHVFGITPQISLDEVAACALWNSGDRAGWILHPHGDDHFLVRDDHQIILAVILKPDDTIEPKQP